MIALYRGLFVPRGDYSAAEQSQARITLYYSAFFVVLNGLVLLGSFFSASQFKIVLFSAGLLGILANVSTIGFIHLGRLRWALTIFTFYLVVCTVLSVYTTFESNIMLVLALPMIYIGLIYGTRGTIAITLFVALVIIIIGVGDVGLTLRASTDIPPKLGVAVLITLVSGIAAMLLAFINEQRRVNSYATKLVSQLRATAEVAQTTSTILELDELLERTVTYIRDRFAFYHVQIFLMDSDRRYANLVASTGEVGQALLQRGHRLAVGSQSIIGRVTLNGTPTIALDTASDPVHRANELLPETRSELALPLIAGDQIIGALDVQSTRPNAFVQEDIDSLGIMATQISISIRNAQLFAEQRKALDENRRLYLETETNLREIERLNQRLTSEAWDEYLLLRRSPVIGFTLQDSQLQSDNAWTPGLTQAINKRRAVINLEGQRQIVAVPVELRGRPIGAIEVETSGTMRQADILELLLAVAQRLALSLDNARLFEQAQEVAQQELEVNAISAKMQRVTDVDEILQTVLNELGRVLGADQASIRLGAPSTKTNGNGKGHS